MRVCGRCGTPLQGDSLVCPECTRGMGYDPNKYAESRRLYQRKLDLKRGLARSEKDTPKEAANTVVNYVVPFCILATFIFVIGMAIINPGSHSHPKPTTPTTNVIMNITVDFYFTKNRARTVITDCKEQIEFAQTVWDNCQNKVDAEDTDPFTKDSSGKFYEDPQDAFDAWRQSEQFSSELKAIDIAVLLVDSNLKMLAVNPDGHNCEDLNTSFDDVKKLYIYLLNTSQYEGDFKSYMSEAEPLIKAADEADELIDKLT